MTANETPTVRAQCSYCGVGCGITVETDATRQVIAKVSGDKLHPANAGRLCTKGATHAEMMSAPGRMTTAYVRPSRQHPPEPVDVDGAIQQAAARIRDIVDEHGPDAVAIYVSGQMTLEAQYLAAKLAKGYLRTVHLESNSRLCMASAGTGYKQSLGADGPPGSYDDFDHADLFFVSGSNMADCHPILFLRMTDRIKSGAKLIVVGPRRTATADKADLFLQIKPGTDLALLNGLLHLLVENGDIDREFIAEHTEGWAAMEPLLADYPPSRVAAITGLTEDDIRTAARWIGAADNWMSCWTMGLNQSTHGTWNTNAICNLHLATGAICRTGSGPFSLTGQPNAMGGREMGYMGPGLPGQRSVVDPADRAFVEAAWGLGPGTIRTDIGTGTVDMFAKIAAGEIKACWIICTNPVASVANRKTVVAGLEAADLVITQDVFTETATNAYADIMLPAASWTESEGVMVNSERNVTLVQQAVEPVGQARPDWQLIAQMAAALGYGAAFDYASSAEIFDEIRQFVNPRTGYDLRGIDYPRLRRSSMQWPAPPGASPRNPIRYVTEERLRFPTPNGRAKFLPRPHLAPAEMPDDNYPFVLNTGRLQYQWHTMTKTGKVDKLNKLSPAPFVEINAADADALGITEEHQVEITSRRGRAVLPAVRTDRVSPGNCFAPFHWNDEHGEYLTVNAVTNDAVDQESLQPEFKVSAVSLRPVAPMTKTQPTSVNPARRLAAITGADTVTPPVPTELERTFLNGFFAALDLAAPLGVPTLPASAPLAPATRVWVEGLLAGTYSAPRLADATETSVEVDAPVLVLWASQTGNAEELAHRFADRLSGTNIRARTLSMDACDIAELAKAERAVIFSSTFGDGGPPDNGADFWERLTAADAPKLDSLHYSVLALGDSSYDDFCGHGRKIDDRLAELGARRMLTRVECEADDDDLAHRWAADVVKLLSSPRVAPTAAPGFTRTDPLQAPLVRNVLLTGTGSAKEVRQLGFELGEGVTYDAGDALGVFPTIAEGAVSEWLSVTGLDGAQTVDLDGELPLAETLRTRLDICGVTPALLRFVADRNEDPLLAKLLRRDNRNELDSWLWGRQMVDVLRAFPVDADLVDWLSVLKKLQPRLYSISSSPLVSPREVELTVSVVRYESGAGGVCSTFLADRAEQPVPIFLQRAPHFRPPADPTVPMIMVGPGTGVAPFRAFLQERRALGATGKNWLFFGEQNSATNFYYRDELEDMFRDGFLNRLDLAFSRDQRERIYVQHRMIEHGAQLWRWISDGAHFYVCGDAARMAKDVDDTLVQIFGIHGNLDEEEALAFRKQLMNEKRYVRDVY
ncbi:molybdopterin-dependent oxidoreductase [Skermania sp. ID1734]|uniref:bifunctional nitrate reductase/sulfite reductase flavoprotein subunit alpha n=1 Tax=Skermania sp. ID1734 TaxID=2597516 RepID=UPI00117D6A70|nr:bifunctional nitrate reductase/sulfite reductase flavoprotein subunit alpha [Skermania sp. ID1734]TSD95616.1 molybdopterin-dependent oxidoreductase [Skermania sp. ID1734]